MLLFTSTFHHRPTVLLIYNTRGVCFHDIWACLFHPLHYHGCLIWLPHAEVVVVAVTAGGVVGIAGEGGFLTDITSRE